MPVSSATLTMGASRGSDAASHACSRASIASWLKRTTRGGFGRGRFGSRSGRLGDQRRVDQTWHSEI